MLHTSCDRTVVVILGPTASGKTAAAVQLAVRVNGEIISADSRAFYRGLDVVTDKPSESARTRVLHHLIDCIPFDREYDAMAFRRDVERLLPTIFHRDRSPIIAGGGTLYLGAVLRGVFEGPSKSAALREQLAGQPLSRLLDELQAVDPEAAERIHPHDRLRILRALEVFRSTGKPISQWHCLARPLPEAFQVVGLFRERSDHRDVIAQRVRQMLEQGVLTEVDGLLKRGLAPYMQAYRTIGIPEAVQVLKGTLTEEGFAEQVVQRTWQLARRQMAWFRRDKNVHWISVTGRSMHEVVDEILHTLPHQSLPYTGSSR